MRRNFLLLPLLWLLGTGCATAPKEPIVRPAPIAPMDGFQTHRAVFTALGKQYTFNGYLATSQTGAKRLLVTENFGMVFADLIIKPDGTVFVMQSNKVFTPKRIKKYVAADLEALFGNPAKPAPISRSGENHYLLKRRFYTLDLRIITTKTGPQPAEMFDETKIKK